MKKLIAIAFIALLSSGAYAGCLSNVKEAIATANNTQNKRISLLTEKSTLLEKGQESMAYGGEIYNNTQATVEVFFIKESNGYYNEFSALLLEQQSCKIIARQSLGDDA